MNSIGWGLTNIFLKCTLPMGHSQLVISQFMAHKSLAKRVFAEPYGGNIMAIRTDSVFLSHLLFMLLVWVRTVIIQISISMILPRVIGRFHKMMIGLGDRKGRRHKISKNQIVLAGLLPVQSSWFHWILVISLYTLNVMLIYYSTSFYCCVQVSIPRLMSIGMLLIHN